MRVVSGAIVAERLRAIDHPSPRIVFSGNFATLGNSSDWWTRR